jgi:hypothetical protein
MRPEPSKRLRDSSFAFFVRCIFYKMRDNDHDWMLAWPDIITNLSKRYGPLTVYNVPRGGASYYHCAAYILYDNQSLNDTAYTLREAAVDVMINSPDLLTAMWAHLSAHQHNFPDIQVTADTLQRSVWAAANSKHLIAIKNQDASYLRIICLMPDFEATDTLKVALMRHTGADFLLVKDDGINISSTSMMRPGGCVGAILERNGHFQPMLFGHEKLWSDVLNMPQIFRGIAAGNTAEMLFNTSLMAWFDREKMRIKWKSKGWSNYVSDREIGKNGWLNLSLENSQVIDFSMRLTLDYREREVAMAMQTCHVAGLLPFTCASGGFLVRPFMSNASIEIIDEQLQNTLLNVANGGCACANLSLSECFYSDGLLHIGGISGVYVKGSGPRVVRSTYSYTGHSGWVWLDESNTMSYYENVSAWTIQSIKFEHEKSWKLPLFAVHAEATVVPLRMTDWVLDQFEAMLKSKPTHNLADAVAAQHKTLSILSSSISDAQKIRKTKLIDQFRHSTYMH